MEHRVSGPLQRFPVIQRLSERSTRGHVTDHSRTVTFVTRLQYILAALLYCHGNARDGGGGEGRGREGGEGGREGGGGDEYGSEEMMIQERKRLNIEELASLLTLVSDA
eukprot:758430-Hanusia_phi.AAC.2